MTEETKDAQEPETQEAPADKFFNANFLMPNEVNQNSFKNWLKTCPFSIEGGQSIRWEPEEGGFVSASIKVQIHPDVVNVTKDEDIDNWLSSYNGPARVAAFNDDGSERAVSDTLEKNAEAPAPSGDSPAEQNGTDGEAAAAAPVTDDNGNPHPMEAGNAVSSAEASTASNISENTEADTNTSDGQSDTKAA